MLGAHAAATDATANTPSPTSNIRLRPWRSPSRPMPIVATVATIR